MQVRAERGELRITRETFTEHFDGWLKGHHRASKATREGYRAAAERRLKRGSGALGAALALLAEAEPGRWTSSGAPAPSSWGG
jgi:hypothetical protein